MSVPFKYFLHEIFKKPKPTPAIRVYPAAPHEFFIPKPTEKPVTTIRARLWSQNPHPQTQKKQKKKRDPARPIGNVDPPAAETHRPTLRRRRHHLHLQPLPLRTSTTTDTKTQDIALPLFYDSSRRCLHRPRATTAVDPKHRVHHQAFFQFRGCCPF